MEPLRNRVNLKGFKADISMRAMITSHICIGAIALRRCLFIVGFVLLSCVQSLLFRYKLGNYELTDCHDVYDYNMLLKHISLKS